MDGLKFNQNVVFDGMILSEILSSCQENLKNLGALFPVRN